MRKAIETRRQWLCAAMVLLTFSCGPIGFASAAEATPPSPKSVAPIAQPRQPEPPQEVTPRQNELTASDKQQTIAKEQPRDETDDKTQLLPPNQRFYAIGELILTMALLFYLLFSWQRRIEQSGYFARIYKEAVTNIEESRHAGPIQENWVKGKYIEELLNEATQRARDWREKNHYVIPKAASALYSAASDLGNEPENKNDKDFYVNQVRDCERSMRQYLFTTLLGSGANPFGGSSTGGMLSGTGWSENRRPGGLPGLFADERVEAHISSHYQEKEKLFSTEFQKFGEEIRDWVEKTRDGARYCYSQDLEESKKEAEDAADEALSVDLSAIRGRGPEFVLEFTAIVIIIFAAVILGLAAVLKNEQIGTLLAAIAGYVLGKANSRNQSAPTGAPTQDGGKK